LPLASTEILASTELPAFTETPEVLASPTNNVACPPSGGPHQIGAILEVIDGSSAKVIIDGQTYTVKYLGVLSPIPANEYFEYSKQKNAELTQGQIVTLIARENYKDVGDTLPRYVFIGDLFVNLELIKQGYAAWDREAMLDEICTVPFMVAAQAAVDAQAGLFGMPSNDPVAVASTATEQVYIPPTATKRVFVAPTSEVIVPIFTQAPSSVTCCKHCGPNSQPCGNSCISLRYTCHKGQGCACW
jgi:endonuclease YncB( thermonuclease family)